MGMFSFLNPVNWIGSAVGGVVNGVASLIGNNQTNKANKAMTNATNEMNYKINKETNEQNYQIWQEQKQHEIDMWNMQNEYNDPSAQRARLEAAGFNPYSMMEFDGSSGSVGQTTPPTMNPMEYQTPPPQEDGISKAMNSVMQSLSLASQIRSADAGIKKTNAETDTLISNLDWSKEWNPLQKRLITSQLDSLAEDLQFRKETRGLQKTAMELANDQVRCNISLTKLDVASKEICNKYLDEEKQLGLAQQYQNLYNSFIQGKISYEDFKRQGLITTNYVLRNAGLALQNEGQRISNDIANQQFQEMNDTSEFRVNGIKAENNQKVISYNEAKKVSDSFVRATIAANYRSFDNDNVFMPGNKNTSQKIYRGVQRTGNVVRGLSPFSSFLK